MLRKSNQKYVIIFDQDSVVTTEILTGLHESLEKITADIYVPVIENAGKVISPGKLLWIKGSHIDRLKRNTILPKSFTAMMSGLCVARSFLKKISPNPFDERLRFYGVDTRFCRDASANNATAYVYDAVLPHDSALRNVGNKAETIERHIWLWQSWLHVFDKNIFEKIAIRLYIGCKILSSARRGSQHTLRQLIAKVYQ